MNLTRSSIKNPAAVVVVSLIMVLFGLLAVAKLPVQLLPSIEQPQIFIQNGWRAAAPEEMESTIIEPQEAALRTVPGVTESSSFIGAGFGFITLTFDVGQDMQKHDSGTRAPHSTSCFNIILLLNRHRFSTNDPRVPGDRGYPNGNHHIRDTRTKQRHHNKRQ